MSKPRRKRRERTDDDAAFGDQTPWGNPAAVYGWRCAVVGMTPAIGMILGPLAITLGSWAFWRHHAKPDVGGYSQSRAAVVLGSLESICNAAGLWLIGRGAGWWA
jgi:hypothetical protein